MNKLREIFKSNLISHITKPANFVVVTMLAVIIAVSGFGVTTTVNADDEDTVNITAKNSNQLTGAIKTATAGASSTTEYIITLKSGANYAGVKVPSYTTIDMNGATFNSGRVVLNSNTTLKNGTLKNITVKCDGADSVTVSGLTLNKTSFNIGGKCELQISDTSFENSSRLLVSKGATLTSDLNKLTFNSSTFCASGAVKGSFTNNKIIKSKVGFYEGINGDITGNTFTSSDCLRLFSKSVTSISDNTFSAGCGISIDSKGTINITSNTFTSIEGNAIYIVGSASGEISGNTMTTVSKHGIYLNGYNGDVKSNTLKAITGIGILADKLSGNICKNTIKNSKDTAINVKKLTGDISFNKIRKSSNYGIYFVNVSGDIANNNVKNVKLTAIRGTGGTVRDIKNNKIYNAKQNGIGVYKGCKARYIDNNTVDTIGGVNVLDHGNYGIIISSGCKKITYCKAIRNNKVSNVTNSGITVYGGAKAYKDTVYVKEDISGNTITNVGTYKHSANWTKETHKMSLTGIYLDTYAWVKGDICNNTINKAAEYGIYAHTYSKEGNVYGNMITNTKGTGIFVNNYTKANKIYNNTIKNGGTFGIEAACHSTINFIGKNTYGKLGLVKTGYKIVVHGGSTVKKYYDSSIVKHFAN